MGDATKGHLRVRFDGRLKLKFLGSKVTTDAGLLACRELDEAPGLTEMGADALGDSRQGSNKQRQLGPLLRQSVYSRLAGYEDVNDAERLAIDPAMRHVVGGRAALADRQAASTSGVGRFETEILSTKANLRKLMDLSGHWIDNVRQRSPLRELILDMDSSVSETYGNQQGTAYRYAIRIRANAALEREIGHLLKRPVGRPSRKPKVFYRSFQYQAKSWKRSRRIVAKVKWQLG